MRLVRLKNRIRNSSRPFSFRAHYSPRPNRESERGCEKEAALADAVRRIALVCGAVAEEDLPPVVSRLPACGVGLHRLAVPHHPLLLGFELDQVLEFLEMKSDFFRRSWFVDLLKVTLGLSFESVDSGVKRMR